MAPYKRVLASVVVSTALIASGDAAEVNGKGLRGSVGEVHKETKNIEISKNWEEGDVDPEWKKARPANAPCDGNNPCQFILISDLDSGNRKDKGKKIDFESSVMRGDFQIVDGKYQITFVPGEERLSTKYNEGGRGGELSELMVWKNKWITADDRTGIVFQLRKRSPHKLLPRFIFNEGDGSSSAKGFKIEWMTEKNDKLVIGSHGNDRKDDEGVMGNNLKWVILVDGEGRYERQDWTQYYQKIADSLGAGPEGYATHEAIEWSEQLKQWVILPRRFSTTKFDEKEDDHKGTNKIAFCSEDFSECKAVTVSELENSSLKGFASFKFVPGTNDTVIAALRSAEDNANDTQESFLSVFTIDGKLLYPETKVPNAHKLEGFAFV